jgi:hypothetical protein
MEDKNYVHLKLYLNELNEIVKELELIKEKQYINELNNYLEQLKCADSKGLDELLENSTKNETNSNFPVDQIKLKLKFKLNKLISQRVDILNQILLVNLVFQNL